MILTQKFPINKMEGIMNPSHTKGLKKINFMKKILYSCVITNHYGI